MGIKSYVAWNFTLRHQILETSLFESKAKLQFAYVWRDTFVKNFGDVNLPV